MTTGADIIAKAKKFLGQNGTRFWNDYGCPKGWAWCVIFVWDIFRMCGASQLFYGGNKVAGCGLLKSWLDKYCTKVNIANAQAGDVVMFSWRSGEISHTGFAIKPLSSSVLQTIEGNTNGGVVAIRQRDKKYILGIYRPKYASPHASTPSTKINKTYRSIAKGGSYVRALPKVGATIIGGIPYNGTFNASEQSGNWVLDSARKGWVCVRDGSRTYLQEVAKAYSQRWKVNTRAGSNVRKGAGTSYAKVRALPYGTIFTATKRQGDWVYSSQYGGWLCVRQGSSVYLVTI